MAPPAWPLRLRQVLWVRLERGHPVTQGLCVLLVHSWLSPRVSSSRPVATAPSPAGLPHCAAREQGSLIPRRAVQAKLSSVDPHDERGTIPWEVQEIEGLSWETLGGSWQLSNESTEDRSGVSIHIARSSPSARTRAWL